MGKPGQSSTANRELKKCAQPEQNRKIAEANLKSLKQKRRELESKVKKTEAEPRGIGVMSSRIACLNGLLDRAEHLLG